MMDRFYPIVGDADWVERLVPLGVKLIQLRIKDLSYSAVIDDIIKSKILCKSYGAQLVVNDYWQVALDQGCDFVHLGQQDMDTADFAALRRAGVRIGLSTHDDDELERALAYDPAYVALGPIYPTLLKKMPWAPQGLDRLHDWKARIGQTPLVAIGGLTIDRLPGVFAAGADSAAVVTDLLQAEDPEARTRDWIAATRAP
jgi:thiamine-phosphate pyrophosphorylase